MKEGADMYELVQVGEKTYYINCPAKIGIYKISDTEVCLIDSGSDKDAGKKVLRILENNGWILKMIFNTHSHADHIGGNQVLQQRTNCEIYSCGVDCALIEFPILEPSFLYGGYPCKKLRNKFLYAKSSDVKALTEEILPDGLEMIALDGHSFSMTGFKTDDGVWFLADSITSQNIIEKYHVQFLYDVSEYLNSLHKVKGLEGSCFIPSHAEPTENIQELVQLNLAKVEEIISVLQRICLEPRGFDQILQEVFDYYHLIMDFTQNVLVGSTIRSYLAYMCEEQYLEVVFENNQLLWKS